MRFQRRVFPRHESHQLLVPVRCHCSGNMRVCQYSFYQVEGRKQTFCGFFFRRGCHILQRVSDFYTRCRKQQNSLAISQSINSDIRTECSLTADLSSAQAFFSAYCNLNNGTSDFPIPSSPPGDMTYYITDMPQYSSMAPCARSALSRAAQNSDACPRIGPQALASCACLKE